MLFFNVFFCYPDILHTKPPVKGCREALKLPGTGYSLLHREAGFRYVLIRILCLCRTHMVDIEHMTVHFVSVCFDPGYNRRIRFPHLIVTALDDAACNLHRRKRLKLDMRCVLVGALYRHPGKDLHVFFLVLGQTTAIARPRTRSAISSIITRRHGVMMDA